MLLESAELLRVVLRMDVVAYPYKLLFKIGGGQEHDGDAYEVVGRDAIWRRSRCLAE